MKIFVNCSNLISGGGLTVGLGVVNALSKLAANKSFVIFVPNTSDYSKFESSSSIKIIKNKSEGFFSKLFLEWTLSTVAKNEKCDAILSLSNYAIASNLPQSLLLHWPYAVYPEKEIWGRMSFTNKLKRKFRLLKLKYLLPNSDQLIVQTDVMKKRAQSYLVPKKNITVIPTSVGFLGDDEDKNITDKIKSLKFEGNKVFLCINEYYEHKNLEILIPLAQKIKEQKLKFKFVITLNNNVFKSKIIGLEDVIVNVGRVKRTQTKELYKKCDALFFPSLIESFGIPLVEAQEIGLPIYTSDRDFAHAVCGDKAIFFNPNSVDDILEKIQSEKSNVIKDKIYGWEDITLDMLNTLNN